MSSRAIGGHAATDALTPAQLSARGKKGAKTRWGQPSTWIIRTETVLSRYYEVQATSERRALIELTETQPQPLTQREGKPRPVSVRRKGRSK